MSGIEGLAAGLADLVGAAHVVTEPSALRPFLSDATEARGMRGEASAVVAPGSAEEVARVMAYCYEQDLPITPRGGGTGYAGGAVPNGGIVLSLARLQRVRAFDAELWRAEVEAGVDTARLRRLARESGLYYPPDPGAAEQSQLGGNAATNAGGPHAFKYGVTGAWITGVEAVLPPGVLVRFGGIRKDVAGYDLRSLLIGSEGTLGVITALTVRMIPAPETARAVVASYADERSGCNAVLACLASGAAPAALEYLDAGAVELARGGFPGGLGGDARFVLIAEVDGDRDQVGREVDDLRVALAGEALELSVREEGAELRDLWRWRDGLGLAADAALGGKVSEDVAVPTDRLHEAILATRRIAERHGLRSCSWGHAGDGNLHSSFLFDRADPAALRSAVVAADELFAAAVSLGGTISGEHGLGLAKSGHLHLQWHEKAVDMHEGVKRLFDPRGLLNPGKKTP